MRASGGSSPPSDAAIAALLALTSIVAYELTGLGRPTSFDYFGRLAEAFLAGRWWLENAPPYLVELVPCGVERLCVAYPLAPALVALPFVPLFGSATGQTLASAVAGGLAAAPAFLAMRSLEVPRTVAATVTVFAMFGTTLWFTSAIGDAWFFAHAVAVLFASIAVLGALRGWPAWAVGVLIGTAALARFPVALALPALAFIVGQRRSQAPARAIAVTLAGFAPLAGAELLYNMVRWGEPLELGYSYLSLADNPSVPHGLLSLRYVPDHLYAIFVRLPELGTAPFWIRPSRFGLSVLLLSPAFLLILPALSRLRANRAFPALVAAGIFALVPDLVHGGVGARQLGYRFLLDAQPFLLPLVALGAAWRGSWGPPPGRVLALVGWSLVANAYAVATILIAGFA